MSIPLHAMTSFVEHIEEIGLVGYSPEELNMILDTMLDQQTDLVVEWGTNIGQSARIFYEAREWLGLPCVIHSVEIQRELGPVWGYERGHWVKDLDVRLHIGDGVTRGVDLWHASGAHRPLFFLDDNHAESEVLRQLRMIAVEAPEAVMLIHDTHTPVYGNEIGASYWMLHEPGVAIQTFLKESPDYDYEEVLVGQCMVRLWPK